MTNLRLNFCAKLKICASIAPPLRSPETLVAILQNRPKPTKTQMKKTIFTHTIIRFIILTILYFSWLAVYAEAGYRAPNYDLDLLILYLFFLAYGIIILETCIIYKKNRPKAISNILLLILFAIIYILLPQRTHFYLR